MKVSLIVTVYNEARDIARLMESIVAQSRPPDEIVIVDGGSTDNTVEIIRGYADRLPLTVKVEPGANISRGRNLAIEAATGDVIAATDAGVRLHPDWLAHLVAPFESDPGVQTVAGFFLPDARTPFEVALGATTLPALGDIKPASFAPSSRSVAYRRAIFKQAGGYPEWLDYCEDLILDFNLMALNGAFEFAPEAIVYFRPRHSLSAFVRQYYLYARGDGKANLFFKRHLIRYTTYFVALPWLALAGVLFNPLWWLGFLPGAVYMFAAGYRRLPTLWADLSLSGKLTALLWVPVIRVAGDLGKMAGYPAGWLWRGRQRPPDWRVTPPP